MLLEAKIDEKQAGAKVLLRNTELQIQAGEVIGFIGRNGVGKTSLARIISGVDSDYVGTVRLRKGVEILTTEQEQHDIDESMSVVEYVLHGLREYDHLTHIIETYPATMGDDMGLIEEYTNALERYDELGYYHVKDQVVEPLKAYQLSKEQILGSFSDLSGGQKRFAQLVQIEYSNADLLILDEPTNHMDYVAKESFTAWLREVRSAVLVISHDRDVLACADRMIELKDQKLQSFSGNYEAYLKQNTLVSASAMHQYEVNIKTLENRREALKQAELKKVRTKQSPNPFIPLVRRLEREIAELEERISKPTIWIDQESAQSLKRSQTQQYEKYKAKSINLRGAREVVAGNAADLIRIDELSLGYAKPLFSNLSFELRAGERVHIVGRNGAGKTTLVDAITATAEGGSLTSKVFAGSIDYSSSLVLGCYEQEIDGRYLTMTLAEAVADIYSQSGRPVNDEAITRALREYLFERQDGVILVDQLSGGQKARIQLIALFARRPNVLILDEPTNHLDLPSIEELENALRRYEGAIIYISHDSFFTKNIGGEEIFVGSA